MWHSTVTVFLCFSLLVCENTKLIQQLISIKVKNRIDFHLDWFKACTAEFLVIHQSILSLIYTWYFLQRASCWQLIRLLRLKMWVQHKNWLKPTIYPYCNLSQSCRMSKIRRKVTVENSKTISDSGSSSSATTSSTTNLAAPSRRPSVFERLGPSTGSNAADVCVIHFFASPTSINLVIHMLFLVVLYLTYHLDIHFCCKHKRKNGMYAFEWDLFSF